MIRVSVVLFCMDPALRFIHESEDSIGDAHFLTWPEPLAFSEHLQLLVMRNLDGAAADEFADHRIAGDDVVGSDLFPAQALDRFQQMLHPAHNGCGRPGSRYRIGNPRAGQIPLRAAEERLEGRQVEGESAVDDVIGHTAEGDDAEQFAGADVMPVEDGEERAVVAVLHVAQHSPQQTHVGELGAPPAAAVAFVEDVLGLDVEAELRRRPGCLP